MLGGSSIRLATILGIRVGVNASWFLILFLAIFWLQARSRTRSTTTSSASSWPSSPRSGSSARSCCTSSGHALVARREGIEVDGIDLFFFGGVMKMSRDTTSPGQEFRVAVAGPLVTLLIVVVGGLLCVALIGWDTFWQAARLQDEVVAPARSSCGSASWSR